MYRAFFAFANRFVGFAGLEDMHPSAVLVKRVVLFLSLRQAVQLLVYTIVENGPLATDLQKEKESMLKDYQEDLEKNTWWRQAIFSYYMYGTNKVRDYKPAVEAITAETVQQTLKQLVDAGNVFEVVMFPE